MTSSTPSAARGFTLIEAVIALVILAAAAAGVLLIFAGPMAASADPQIRAQARAIASAYLDEVQLRDYGDGSTCVGGARDEYETIWCYDDTDEQPPRNQFDNALNDLAAYRARVTVNEESSGVASIVVRVTHDSGRVDYELESRRADY